VNGPVWDGAWLLCALWLLPLVFFLAGKREDPAFGPLDTLYFAITAMFWIGHRLGSTWLAYCTEAYRPLLRLQPVRFIVLPLLVTAACFAIFLPPDAALPWTRAERLVGLAILDYALVTYHFGAQHFGALSLYRARAGYNAVARRRDLLFALGVGGFLVFVADILSGAVAYQEQWISRGIPPACIASVEEPIRFGATLALVAATATMIVLEVRAPRPSLPRILYILGLSVMVAVALRPRSLFPFLVLWTSQHWIVATGIVSRTPQGETEPSRGPMRRALHALNTRPWAVVVLFVIASIILLPVFEVEANRQGGTYYGDRIFGTFVEGLRTSAWVPALVALGFATGFMHYLHDRNVFRLSDPKIREAARGLLASNRQSL
jgi:hypothetical protein